MAMWRNRWHVTVAAIAASALLTAGGRGTLAAQGQQGRAGGQGQQQGQRGGAGGGRQARDAATQAPVAGTGSISGYVTAEGGGGPVRRARVSLSGAELRGTPRSAATDDKGYFTFVSLPAGRFTMSVSKASYVTINYGAKKPGRPGTPIQLVDGQKIDRADVGLPKGAVVMGIVIDETGEPSPLTQVRVMRYVMRTGEKTLEQGGQAQTDDRGMYRIWGLQPGDYIVSAVPRSSMLGDIAQTIQATIESLTQQAQALGGGAGGGRGGGGGLAGVIAGALGGGGRGGAGGGRGQQLLDQAAQLQQSLGQSGQAQPVAYAPVYYPGTTSSTAASAVTLVAGDEHAGVDFQLQLVPTTNITGTITSPDGVLPQGTQVSLVAQTGGPNIPGLGSNSARVDQGGKFSFANVTPGQYTVTARATLRAAADPNASQAQAQPPGAAAGGGRGGFGGGQGGPGGRGGPSQVLWASADVTVAGQAVPDVVLNLQPGMTISGRVAFDGTTLQPPTDLTRVRVSLTARGSQTIDMGGMPPAQVDATGNFKLTGVAPGRYVISANAPAGGQGQAGGVGGVVAGAGGAAGGGGGGRGGGAGGGGGRGGGGIAGGVGGAQGGSWTLRSALVSGRDTLDFPLEVRPNEEVGGAMLTFTDRTQQVSGTLQDSSGRPTPDYTIIVFASDRRYWTPQSRRIQSARPDTTGKFTVRNLPPGDYRVSAVTEVENGEWFDPAFLQQLIGASVAFSLAPGDQKTQDLRVAGGGQ
jgi:hypothetical protein